MLNIAKTIREKRRARGYTQERLAQALGLTPAAVSKWETGQALPDVTMLGPLAAMLGITTDELLGFNPDVSEEHAEELVEPARDALARRDISGAIERCERALRLHPASITLAFAVASALMEIAQGACAADDPARSPAQESAAKTALARSIELFERCRQEGSLEQREAAALVLAGQYVWSAGTTRRSRRPAPSGHPKPTRASWRRRRSRHPASTNGRRSSHNARLRRRRPTPRT